MTRQRTNVMPGWAGAPVIFIGALPNHQRFVHSRKRRQKTTGSWRQFNRCAIIILGAWNHARYLLPLIPAVAVPPRMRPSALPLFPPRCRSSSSCWGSCLFAASSSTRVLSRRLLAPKQPRSARARSRLGEVPAGGPLHSLMSVAVGAVGWGEAWNRSSRGAILCTWVLSLLC